MSRDNSGKRPNRSQRNDSTGGFNKSRNEQSGNYRKRRNESAGEFDKSRNEGSGDYRKRRDESAGGFNKRRDGSGDPRDNARYDGRGEDSQTEPSDIGSESRDLIVFGRNTVVSFLERMQDEETEENAQEINKIFLAEGNAPDERINKIKHLAHKLKIPVVNCHNNKLDYMVQAGGRHQGVVAQVSPIKLLEFGEWLTRLECEKSEREAQGRSLDGFLIVALDSVEDPRNVGAIIRSAEAQGVHAVLVPERRAAQITETVAKTSAGAIAHIPIVRIVNLVRCLENLKELGFWILGLAADAQAPIYKMDLQRALVIVVGSEGKGIRPLVKETCDLIGAIPLDGKTESLNASVALGIAVYEACRQNTK